MSDTARSVAFSDCAPPDERRDAMAELQRGSMAQASDQLIAAERIKPLIDFITAQNAEQDFAKSLQHSNIIPFPSRAAREREPGMQSVFLDDIQIGVNGDYFERPGAFPFEAMRQIVDETPVLSAVVITRIRQIQRFCRPQKDGKGPGFKITARDKDNHIDDSEKESMRILESFFQNCGMETNPRERRRLRRDDFSSFMAKLVRDSLTMDSAPIETEFKRDRKLGMAGMYAVDGATVRLCTEAGYRGEDEIFALQVVQGQIRSAYTFDDLIYVPRNPLTSVLSGGYGMSETELLIKVVTGFLNAFTYNVKFFDSNAIPKGILNLYGHYSDQDISAFKRYWNGMVKGVNNAWSLPVMVSKDQESKAQFESFGNEVNELMFGKWMTFLTSIICAIYGMSPEEINFESFTTGASSLSGSDTEEKLINSKDKGLRPLLAYYENLFTDYVVSDFSEKYEFRWAGLDEEDAKTVFERKKLIMTVNEMRAEDGLQKTEGEWGEAPLNPSLVSVWQAENQAEQEDYGMPGAGGGVPGDDPGAGGGDDFGQPEPGDGEDDGGDDDGFGATNQGGGGQGDKPGDGAPPMKDLAKAFGLPVLRVEP